MAGERPSDSRLPARQLHSLLRSQLKCVVDRDSAPCFRASNARVPAARPSGSSSADREYRSGTRLLTCALTDLHFGLLPRGGNRGQPLHRSSVVYVLAARRDESCCCSLERSRTMQRRGPPWQSWQSQRGASGSGERTSPTPRFRWAAARPALPLGAAVPEIRRFRRGSRFTVRSAVPGGLSPVLRTRIHFGTQLPLRALSCRVCHTILLSPWEMETQFRKPSAC